MASQKEGGSIVRPPLLDGTNYVYWKHRMASFIRAVDENSWTSVEEGWTSPVDDEGKQKPRTKWTTKELAASNANQKALNSIQNAVSMEVFTLISMCATAKETWDVLQNTYEGNSKVKKQRLQQLTSRFEELKMDEHETITMFHGKILAIANESFSLGEMIPKERLVRKVMRSLPERFDYKVTAIDEAHDVSDMKLEELIGSLRTFEMNLKSEKSGEKKCIAFAAESRSSKLDMANFDTDDLVKSFALFTKKFGKAFNRFKKKRGTQNDFNNSNHMQSEKNSSMTSIQCYECHGFGHIQSECANTLKKLKEQNKSYNVSQSDEETDESGSGSDEKTVALVVRTLKQVNKYEDPLKLTDSESVNVKCDSEPDKVSDEVTTLMRTSEKTDIDVVAFTVKLNDLKNSESTQDMLKDDDAMDPDEDYLVQNYELMYQKCLAMLEVNKTLSVKLGVVTKERDEFKGLSDSLQKAVDALQQTMKLKISELEHHQKLVKMMNSGTEKLDEILEQGQNTDDKAGIGFHKKQWVPKDEILSTNKVCNPSKDVPPAHVAHASYRNLPPKKNLPSKFVPVCHHCQRCGHIRPRCRFLIADRKANFKNLRKSSYRNHRSYVVRTSSWSGAQDKWYLDSGCSRHMTGNKSLLTNIKTVSGKGVTLGDGVQSKVIGTDDETGMTGKGTVSISHSFQRGVVSDLANGVHGNGLLIS
ncbi:uncharacterized protein LOC130998029 [Salvia miltiorrhiza]|uniref:uncharacterized protein LOC130998029 n=1 Tax=Salvia miltiorrhiza TaxID=226208 RepID=UPI0025AC97C2|nr:uncharacterized protein LOC130998029 [Salvia miltiorrhiza]